MIVQIRPKPFLLCTNLILANLNDMTGGFKSSALTFRQSKIKIF